MDHFFPLMTSRQNNDMIAAEVCLPADLIARQLTYRCMCLMLRDTGDGAPGRVHQVLCLSQWQRFVDCTESTPLHQVTGYLLLSRHWHFYLRSCLVHSRNELVILLVFFCWCLLTGDWNTYCMVTLLEDATVFITSIFYQYFITLLILYIHLTLRSKLVCLLIARFQRAVLYVLYCVLVCVFLSAWAFFFFFNACSLNLVLGYTVVIL